MSSQSPPRLATWLLQRFTSSYCSESLEGDLLESWRGGRGDAWYWRQVLVALLVNAWRTARTHGLSFAVAVGSYGATIWLSRFVNREVFAIQGQLRRELPNALGSTPFAFEMARFATSATELAWFAIVFSAQGYIIGRLHRCYAKTAALTALAVFIVWPNALLLAGTLINFVRNPSGAGLDALWPLGFFVENVICVLFGAAWLAKRWPLERSDRLQY